MMKRLATVAGFATILGVIILMASCRKNYTPKPHGYYRIDFPQHAYIQYDTLAPYKFEYPVYTVIEKDQAKDAEPYWINIVYPQLKGKIHFSYKALNGNLNSVEEDSRQLAYKHTIKADAINERIFNNDEKKVYGIFYEIKGDAASSIQFFVTDSTRNFLRGSLYFNAIPNKDSLAPVIDFVKKDILHLIETFEWKKVN
jgi:gliding motility-associated lipoprotein GldD